MTSRKPHPLILAALAIALLTITFVAGHAQSGPPPVKMGLWESSMTQTLTGLTLPPDVVAKMKAMGRPMPGGEHTTVTQSCVTPEEWQKNWGKLQNDQQNCTRSNVVQNSHEMSFDITCKSAAGSTVGHMQMVFDSREQMHGTMTMKSTQAQGGPINMDMKIKGHYLSSSCGDIKADTPKVISRQ